VSEPGRGEPVCRARGRRDQEGGRGGLGVAGAGVHHCSSVLCISCDGPGEPMCFAERNKNPNTSLLLRVQGACSKSWKKGKH